LTIACAGFDELGTFVFGVQRQPWSCTL